jgi:hypothetical protein
MASHFSDDRIREETNANGGRQDRSIDRSIDRSTQPPMTRNGPTSDHYGNHDDKDDEDEPPPSEDDKEVVGDR